MRCLHALTLLVALAACGGDPECGAHTEPRARDLCLAERAPAVFPIDPAKADALVARIEDQALRDLVNLNLTRDHAPKTDERCKRIQDARLRERCLAVVSRPHLHLYLEPPAP